MVEKDAMYEKNKVFVLTSEGWHHGVIGIVAARIQKV
jgi:single-stranded DNA-specific DHH superfamily exonuclease